MPSALVPDPDSAPVLPRYAQLARLLLREIMAGRLADGQRLPPEREMAAQWGVSVATLRRALADLTARGLLRRVQGSGNYVCGGAGVAGVYAFFRLETAQGGLPSARLLDLGRAPLPPGTGLPGPEGWRIRRLRLLDDRPVAVEEIWLDPGWAPDLTAADLHEALYQMWRQRFGLWITEATDRVRLGAVPAWAPADLGLTPGAPCLCVIRSGRAQTGARAEWSQSWVNSARADYVQRLN